MENSNQQEQFPSFNLDYRENDILKTMYNNEEFCDMVFIVDSTRIPVNRAVMAASSVVFRAMLLGSFQDSRSKEIPIPDVQKQNFVFFIKYIYGFGINEVPSTMNFFVDLLKLSDRYGFPRLHEGLRCYLTKLSIPKRFDCHFVDLMNIAFTFDMTFLYNRLKQTIQNSRDVALILSQKRLSKLSYPVLLDLIKSDYLNAKEIDILRAVLRWIASNEVDNHGSLTLSSEQADSNTRSFVENLLNEIRPTEMSLSDYVTLSTNEPLFKKYETILEPKKLGKNKYYNIFIPRKQQRIVRFTMKCDNMKKALKTGSKLATCVTTFQNDKFTFQVSWRKSNNLFPQGNHGNQLIFKLWQEKQIQIPSSQRHIKYGSLIRSSDLVQKDEIIVPWETKCNLDSPIISNYTQPDGSIIGKGGLVHEGKLSDTKRLFKCRNLFKNDSIEIEVVIEYVDEKVNHKRQRMGTDTPSSSMPKHLRP
uniref:BTB/POZ domain-containing protein 9 n=1 Tax=Cacopsylla melanoneura TaxID=428564 RepID=A0A8D8XLI5_9HEMI